MPIGAKRFVDGDDRAQAAGIKERHRAEIKDHVAAARGKGAKHLFELDRDAGIQTRIGDVNDTNGAVVQCRSNPSHVPPALLFGRTL